MAVLLRTWHFTGWGKYVHSGSVTRYELAGALHAEISIAVASQPAKGTLGALVRFVLHLREHEGPEILALLEMPKQRHEDRRK